MRFQDLYSLNTEAVHCISVFQPVLGFYVSKMIMRSYFNIILALGLFNVSSSSTNLDGLTSGVPVGHLKPLGSHRPPEINLVDDLQEMPSPEEFWTKYVLPSKAVVLRGAAKHGKAFTQWTDDYLKKKFSDLEVRLEGKKEKSSNVPIGAKGVGRDTIGKPNMIVTFSCSAKFYCSNESSFSSN